MIPDLCNIVGMGVVSIIRQRKCHYIELAIGKYVGTYSIQAAKIGVECVTLLHAGACHMPWMTCLAACKFSYPNTCLSLLWFDIINPMLVNSDPQHCCSCWLCMHCNCAVVQYNAADLHVAVAS